MRGHLLIFDDGIQIKSRFRAMRIPWSDIAGFFIHEGGLRASWGWAMETPDSGWVTLRNGKQHQLRRIYTYEQVDELNQLLEQGRARARAIDN